MLIQPTAGEQHLSNNGVEVIVTAKAVIDDAQQACLVVWLEALCILRDGTTILGTSTRFQNDDIHH